ncbi:MAG: FAD-dependent oxidoreductase [Bacillota bacterium]
MGEAILNTWKRAVPEAYGVGDQIKIKALVGWGGLALLDQHVNPVSLFKVYLEAVQEESCGRCVPCRLGSKLMLDIFNRLVVGEGCPEDLDQLERLGWLAMEGSLCELGRSFPVPLLDALREQRNAFLDVIAQKKSLETGGLEFRKIVASPCEHRCPAHLDIPGYVLDIREEVFGAALARIREKTFLAGVLGRICDHPCESSCRRNILEDPVSICRLKRFAADYEMDNRHQPVIPPSLHGEQVAIIGAGPAGLSAAYQLGRKGYQVTVFEAAARAGGMLATVVPANRLPEKVLEYEIGIIESLGVKIKLNTRVGNDVKFADLQAQGFKAVYIAAADLEFLPEAGRDLNVNLSTMETYMPGVFAGGEMTSGEGSAVHAVAAGNRAAASIDQYLREGKVSPCAEDELRGLLDRLGIEEPGCPENFVRGLKRVEVKSTPEGAEASGEAEEGLTGGKAVQEAYRCLRCYRLLMVVS